MSCPECGGDLLDDHPGGPLVFQHRRAPSCSIGDRQDETAYADWERTAESWPITRPPTTAEATLLAAVGLAVPSSVTVTRLTPRGAVLRREY